jgi:predicted thioesterase
MISERIVGEGRMKVTEEDTAASWGSGSLPVLATPAMILLIERTASECLQPLLKEGESTVGTRLDIKHSAPSVIGSEVFCSVELIERDRSKTIFSVTVWDSAGEVGRGRHERFVVENAKFMAGAVSRTDG